MNVRRIVAGMKRLNALLVLLAVSFLACGVLLVSVNVASRYLLYLSLVWSAELVRYAIIWSALLASAVLVNRRQHLTVDVLGSRLSGTGQRLLQAVVAVGSMTFFLSLAISGAILVWRTKGQVAPSIEFLPMPVVYAILPLSALLMWAGAAVDLLRTICDDEGSG